MGDTLRRYWAYGVLLWQASRVWAALGGFVAIGGGLAPVLTVLASGALIGSLPDATRDGISSDAGASALWCLGGFVGALLLSGVLQMLQQVVAQELTAHYLATVQDAVASASLSPEQIDHLEDPATARDFGAVTEALREGGFLFGVGSTLTVLSLRLASIGSAIVLAAFRWWVPLVLFAGWLLVGWAFNRWLSTAFDDLIEVTGSERRRAEYVRGLLMGSPPAKEIRVFGLSSHLVERFSSTWFEAMNAVWRHRRQSFWPLGLGVTTLLAMNAIVFLMLGSTAYTGQIELGPLAVFVGAVLALQNAAVLGDPQTQLGRAATLALHVRSLAKPTSALKSAIAPGTSDGAAVPARTIVPERTRPVGVSLREVSFTFSSRNEPTLRNLSLTVPPGQSIAIVGKNGAGKSTLIKLICGLYLPDSGQIVVDDTNVAAGNLDQVRRRIAVIFQDFVRYHLPLRQNVMFDGDDTTRQRALTDAGGLSLLDRLEFGWDTVLSAEYEGGTDLSGGQWQRVALARSLAAVNRGAGLLILDEPTAALDVRAEAELFDRFLEVTRGVTTILVSHRLSSVRRADRIVVISGGNVAEDGTHDELMELNGEYAAMFALQARRFVSVEAPLDGERGPADA